MHTFKQSVGELAYEAFFTACNGKSIATGNPLTHYSLISREAAVAWERAGELMFEQFHMALAKDLAHIREQVLVQEGLDAGVLNERLLARLLCLTKREMEVLVMCSRGMPNKAIGRVLLITEQTVKNHLHATLKGLSLRRDQILLRNGMIEDRYKLILALERQGVNVK